MVPIEGFNDLNKLGTIKGKGGRVKLGDLATLVKDTPPKVNNSSLKSQH